jgi:mRNA-degrading endonuclease toxin of MazEF toxin-antitoxin module
LRKTSDVMVDKITSVRRDRVRARVGALSRGDVDRLDTALRVWLSL